MNENRLVALPQTAATDVVIVLAQRVEDFGESQAVLDQPMRIDPHLELLFIAAPGIDFRHARHRP